MKGMLTYILSWKLIPTISKYMLKNNIFGYDINKKGSPQGEIKIPECVGFASAIAFIMIAMITCLLIRLYQGYNQTWQIYEQTHLSYLVTILGTLLI